MAVKIIGLIGAGHIGSQLARLAVQQGYDVVVSNSRGPDTLTCPRERAARAPGRDPSAPRQTADQLRHDLAAAHRPGRS